MTGDGQAISLAVWDAPVPVVVDEAFAVKVGAKASDQRNLGGYRVVASDPSGMVVSSGELGDASWPGTEALHWLTLGISAPAAPRLTTYQVRLIGDPGGIELAATEFTVVAMAKPEHGVTVRILEQDTAKPLANVEVRLGPFHARTDANGRAEIKVCTGHYQVHLWRPTHVAVPETLTVAGDTDLEMTMQHAPEEHPDARWVR